MTINAKVIGTGSYLPEKVVTNTDFKDIDTSDEWIQERTGIKTRCFARADETTSMMAIEAAKAALKDAKISIDEIDAIMVATVTPDLTTPATAMIVQRELGMTRGAAFDVSAACSGFLYALSIADSLIKTQKYKKMLVIGAEKLTAITDFTDRSTCVLFGDGAGAVVLSATEEKDAGILDVILRSDGRQVDLLKTTGGVSSTGMPGVIYMNGREVFKHAVTNLVAIADEILEKNGLAGADVDWFVPHQANQRIISATADRLKMPMDRVILTVDHHANTSAASIPLAFDEARKAGKIKKGDLVLMDAMGAGMTWAAALIRM